MQNNIEDLLSNYFYDYEHEDIYKKYYDYLAKNNFVSSDFNSSYDINDVASGDDSLYVEKNFKEIYKNRNILGVNKGNIFENPVLQIAPNYYGYYNNGKIEEVFFYKSAELSEVVFDEKTIGHKKENQEAVSEIYGLINKYRSCFLDESAYDFQTFEIDFNDLLIYSNLENEDFFIDLSFIESIEEIHPHIINIILSHNDSFLQKKNLPCIAKEISPEDFSKKVFPYKIDEKSKSDEMSQYLNLTQLHMRQKVQIDFGIELSDYDFALQRNFLNFLNTRSVENVYELKDFVKEHGDTGLKTFLSVESGVEMGDKILNIANKVKPEIARSIFKQYEQIIRLTEIKEKELGDLAGENKSIDNSELVGIYQNIIQKASFLLSDFSDQVSKTSIVFDEKEILNEQTILNKLKRYRADLILSASVFKTLSKSQDIKIEDIQGVTFEQTTSSELIDNNSELINEIGKIYMDAYEAGGVNFEELSTQIKNKYSEIDENKIDNVFQMLSIYQNNYESRPEFQKKLLEGFIEKLKSFDDKTNIYFVNQDGKVVAFLRFDDLENGEKYFGSCNVDSIVHGLAIGSALFEESLKRESISNNINATCDIFSSAVSMYIEKGKFVATAADLNSEEYGNEPIFHIHRDIDPSCHYANKTKQEIIESYDAQVLKIKNNEYQDVIEKNLILKFSIKKEMLLAIDELVNKKQYKITRYFFDNKEKEYYLSFEQEIN